MKALHIIATIFISSFSIGLYANPEIIEGCEGEGCACLQNYKELDLKENWSSKNEKMKDFEPSGTIRPFKLYEEMNIKSKMLGSFPAKIQAKPIAQYVLFLEKGQYEVEKVLEPKTGLKVGQVVNTRFNLGEGSHKAKSNDKWFFFDYKNVVFKVIKETKTQEWLKLSAEGKTGYTLDRPFESCLE